MMESRLRQNLPGLRPVDPNLTLINTCKKYKHRSSSTLTLTLTLNNPNLESTSNPNLNTKCVLSIVLGGVRQSLAESTGVHHISPPILADSGGVWRTPPDSGGVLQTPADSGGLHQNVWGSVKYWVTPHL